MKHVILFPGSFNPMHIGHLCLANYIVETQSDVDELWMMVTPSNPFKASADLLDEEFRVRWATHQVTEHPGIHISTVELSLPRPNYTYQTIQHLREIHPDYRFTLLIGMDSLINLPKWHRGQELMQEVEILVYPRPGYTLPDDFILPRGVQVIEAPTFDISATRLRNLLLAGQTLPYFLNISTDHPLHKELLRRLSEIRDAK